MTGCHVTAGALCRITGIILLIALCIMLLVSPASADSYVGGIPLETVSEGTVSGGVFIDAYPGFDTRAEKSFSLPEFTKIRWARLYVATYIGNMENNYPGVATVEFNGGGGWQTLGTETLNVPYTFPGKGGSGVVMVNNHCSRVTSDYLMWYDVTSSITTQTVSAKVKTEKMGGTGSFDGRIKTVTLVVAYDDRDQDQVRYWIAQGHDMDSYLSDQELHESYTGEITFDTSALPEDWEQATLRVAYLTSRDAEYTFNDDALESGTPLGAYFGLNTWDVTGLLESGEESTATYDNQPYEFYKTFVGALTVAYPEPDTGSLSVSTSPPGATIFIDGEEQEMPTNTTISGLSEGSHRVSVDKEGCLTPAEVTVTIVRGKTEQVTIPLLALTGQISITSEPSGASVLLDGILQSARTPCVLKDVPAGTHRVMLKMSGYEDLSQEVEVDEGATADLDLGMVLSGTTQDGSGGGGGETSPSLIEGYLGRDVRPVIQGSVRGNVSILTTGDYSGLLSPGDAKEYSISASVPEQARLMVARMNVYTTWSHDERARTGMPAQCGISLNGKPVPIETRYLDRKGSGIYDYPVETLASNLSADLVRDGKNTLVITNTGSGAHAFAVYGATLIIAWEEPDGLFCHYWIAEGSDIVLADEDFGVATDEAVTSVVFPGILLETGVEDATLVLVSTAASGSEETENRVLFNGAEWYNILSGGSSGISRVDLDVRNELNAEKNRVMVQSYAGEGAGDYLENRNAVLVVRTRPGTGGVDEGLRTSEPSPGVTGKITPRESASPAHMKEPPVQDQGRVTDQSLFGSFFSGFDRVAKGFLALFMGPGIAERIEDNQTFSTDAPGEQSPAGLPNHSATYSLRITSDPAGADVTIDGVPYRDRTPLTVQNVPGGDHRVVLTLEDCPPEEREITLRDDADLFVEFDTESISREGVTGTEEASVLGGFYVESYPSGGEISIDGSKTGLVTPHVVYGVREGSHTIKVTYEMEGSEVYTTKAWVYRGALSRVELGGGNHVSRAITITSDEYKGAYFTVDGTYPRYRIPATVNVRTWQGFITLSWNDTYLSIPVPDTLPDGATFLVRPVEPSSITLSVESDPPAALMFIDGFPGLSTPAVIPGISSGRHRIALALDDHIPVDQEIMVMDDPGRKIDASFRGVLVPYVSGSVSLKSLPEGAQVYINNRNTGLKTPVVIDHLPIGEMLLKVKYEKVTREPDIMILPGKTVEYTARFT